MTTFLGGNWVPPADPNDLEQMRRERIAVAAMQGLLATNEYGVHASTVLAGDAVKVADALIAELDKGGK